MLRELRVPQLGGGRAARGAPVDRLWPLLVRCGGCRFVAAGTMRLLIALVESGRDGDEAAGDGPGDVRDVSFPTFGGSL